MSDDWRNELASEQQKEKLRFFGCTWDDGITAGQAEDALAECAIQFPDAEATWQKNQPATEKQKEKLRYFGCTWNGDITVGKASDALLQCASDFPDKEADWQFQKKKWSKVAGSFPGTAFEQSDGKSDKNRPVTDAQLDELRSLGREPVRAMTFGEAMELIETIKARNASRRTDAAATFQKETKSKDDVYLQSSTPEVAGENLAWIINHKLPPEPKRTDPKYQAWINPKGQEYGFDLDHLRWEQSVAKIKAQIEAERKSRDRKAEGDAQQPTVSSKVSNSAPNVFIKEPEPPFYLKYPAEPSSRVFSTVSLERLHSIWTVEVKQTEAENRRRYDRYVAEINQWNALRSGGAIKQPEPFPNPPEQHDVNPQTDPAKETAAAVTQPKTRSEGFFCGTPGSPTAASDKLPEQKSSPSKWSNLFEERKRAEEVTIQEAAKPQSSNPSEYTIPAREVQSYAESSAVPSGKVGKVLTKEPKRPKYISYPREPRRQSFNSGLDFDYDYEKAKTNWIAEVKTIEAENRRRHDIYCAAIKSWYVQHNWNTDWEPQPFPKSPLSQNVGRQEVTIQEVVNPRIQKPTAYSYHAPIERFAEWVDGFTERNVTCPGGHWLPAGPLSYVFASDAITIDLCRQMAETIESRGYCVEPDARFGNGTYDRNQTLALFKPLDGDPIQPSTAYLGAANLLRLCILITTADGKIDLVELDLFRQVIENQVGLTLTDHKRLLVLEQLLAQELCSATQTAAKIAKSVPADKRLVIAHLLVQVAAANNEITRDERRALERIFKAFAIPLVTLENYIYQICNGRAAKVYGDISKNDKWLWNHWRTGHPGVVIDDDTLAGKTWNFTDWKALNARWRDLNERLVAKQFNNLPDADSPEGGTKVDGAINRKNVSAMEEFLAAGRLLGASSEQIPKKTSWVFGFCKCCAKENASMSRSPSGEVRSYCIYCEGEIKNRIFDQRLDRWIKRGQSAEQFSNPVTAQPPRAFALDMERVYQITNETKEVVAILSIVMADEPEESIKLPSKITLPAPDIAKVSSDSKDAPQATRFNGLDAAFRPILERLLTRESWPVDDFDALAREFHFMPGKICETINEWSDEALGEFILDGDDPVVIRRELIAKETIYG